MRLTENNKELNRYTVSALIANHVMRIQHQTGMPLEDLMSKIGESIVWTPVGDQDGNIKIIASILVLTNDRKNILVCSPNTNPTHIEEVTYIFTEFGEALQFLSDKNLIPDYSDEDEISYVPEGEQVVYLPIIDDIFEDEDKDEDEIEIDIEVLMVIKLLARILNITKIY